MNRISTKIFFLIQLIISINVFSIEYNEINHLRVFPQYVQHRSFLFSKSFSINDFESQREILMNHAKEFVPFSIHDLYCSSFLNPDQGVNPQIYIDLKNSVFIDNSLLNYKLLMIDGYFSLIFQSNLSYSLEQFTILANTGIKRYSNFAILMKAFCHYFRNDYTNLIKEIDLLTPKDNNFIQSSITENALFMAGYASVYLRQEFRNANYYFATLKQYFPQSKYLLYADFYLSLINTNNKLELLDSLNLIKNNLTISQHLKQEIQITEKFIQNHANAKLPGSILIFFFKSREKSFNKDYFNLVSDILNIPSTSEKCKLKMQTLYQMIVKCHNPQMKKLLADSYLFLTYYKIRTFSHFSSLLVNNEHFSNSLYSDFQFFNNLMIDIYRLSNTQEFFYKISTFITSNPDSYLYHELIFLYLFHLFFTNPDNPKIPHLADILTQSRLSLSQYGSFYKGLYSQFGIKDYNTAIECYANTYEKYYNAGLEDDSAFLEITIMKEINDKRLKDRVQTFMNSFPDSIYSIIVNEMNKD